MIDYVRIFLIILIFILTVTSYIIYRDITNPSFIFCFFWFSILTMYSLRFYGLYNSSNRPFLYIVIGCLAFFLGSHCLGNKKISITNKKNEYIIQERVIVLLFIISFIFFFRKDILTLLNVIRGGSIYNVRYGGIIQSTYIEDVVVKFVARPYAATITCIGFSELLLANKKAKRHLIMALVLMIQSVLFDGILVMFEFLISCVFVSYILNRFILKRNNKNFENNKVIKRKKRIIFLILGIGLFILFLIKGSIFKTIYMHFTPSIIYLDNRLKVIDSFRYSGDVMMYTYGMTTLQGIIRPIMAILDMIGLSCTYFDSATKFLLDNHDFVIHIADGEYFNFFTTSFAFYYKDFGVVGIVIFPFLYGKLCNRFYLNLKNKLNIINVCLYLFFVSGILLTIKVSFFSYTEIIVALYWLRICFKKKRNKYHRNIIG